MFCHQCGVKVNEGEAFCSQCGTKVSEDEKSYAQYYFSTETEPLIKSPEKSKESPKISPNPSEKLQKPPVELQKPSEKSRKLSKKQKSEKKSSVNTVLIVLTIVFAILSVALGTGVYVATEDKNYYQAKYSSLSLDCTKLKKDKNYYESAYKELKSSYDEIKESYDFFDDFARIVPDDKSRKYHRYGCSKLDSDASFWIYNINAAEDYASPCQYCCNDD